MLVSDIMTVGAYTCPRAATAKRAALMMVENKVGFMPVVDDEGRLIGVITDRDLATKVLGEGLSPSTPIYQVMSTTVRTVFEDDPEIMAEDIIVESRLSRLVVIDREKHCKGIVSLTDIAMARSPIRAGRLLHEVVQRKARGQTGNYETPSITGQL